MTVEEALEILDTIPTIHEQVDALEMSIEALENQSSVIEELEKIKAEILKYHCIKCYGTCETYCPYSECIEPKDVIEDLQIIDKHIAELKGE